MARIAGVDLPRDKRVEIGLTYIYGIGLTLSKEILEKQVSIQILAFVTLLKMKLRKSVLFLMKSIRLKVTFVVKKHLTLSA